MTLKTMTLRLHCLALGLVLMAISSGVGLAQAPQSASFKMDRFTVASVAQTTGGAADYSTTVVLGQDSVVGATSACNAGFRTSLGYWSHRGDLEVPIQLRAAKSGGFMELSWSGAAPIFEVYRASSAFDVVNPGDLFQLASSCEATDNLAQAPTIFFYQVIPQQGN